MTDSSTAFSLSATGILGTTVRAVGVVGSLNTSFPPGVELSGPSAGVRVIKSCGAVSVLVEEARFSALTASFPSKTLILRLTTGTSGVGGSGSCTTPEAPDDALLLRYCSNWLCLCLLVIKIRGDLNKLLGDHYSILSYTSIEVLTCCCSVRALIYLNQ